MKYLLLMPRNNQKNFALVILSLQSLKKIALSFDNTVLLRRSWWWEVSRVTILCTVGFKIIIFKFSSTVIVTESSKLPYFCLNFSTKNFKVSKCFMLLREKYYPCEFGEIINNYKSISFSTNVGYFDGTKQIYVDNRFAAMIITIIIFLEIIVLKLLRPLLSLP